MSDEEILEAAARVIGRKGPLLFTLREVGDEIGLHAATIVQRFKTKRGLLLALVERGAAAVDATFAAARAGARSPLAALLDALAASARTLGRPEEVANHLAFLQLDLTDPELRPHARAVFVAIRTNAERLIAEAVASKELHKKTDAVALARAVESAYHGALITWAVHREGRAEEAVRAAVSQVVEWGGGPPRGA